MQQAPPTKDVCDSMRQYDLAFAGKPMTASYSTLVPDCSKLNYFQQKGLHNMLDISEGALGASPAAQVYGFISQARALLARA